MATTATPATGIAATTGTKGRFVWHELMTTDPKAAQTFYTQVVGWKTSKMEGGEIPYDFWLTGDTPDTMIGGLMAMQPDALKMGAPSAWTAYTEVPDTDATVAQAVKLGATVLLAPTTVEQAGRFAILQDPQGAVFAVIKSATPLQPETDPKVGEFSWHELGTSDQAGAITFYEQLFGWEKKSEFDMGKMGMYYMFGRDRFTYGGIMQKAADAPPTHWLHVVRVADTADAAAVRAKKAGGTLILGPMDVPGGDRIAVLSEPLGAVFAVHSKP
jgi:predicted enzyme related to lactoylglutathione lyase